MGFSIYFVVIYFLAIQQALAFVIFPLADVDLGTAKAATSSDYDVDEEKDRPRRRRGRAPLRKSTTSLAQVESDERAAQAQAKLKQALKDPTLLTQTRFSDRDDLRPSVKRAIVSVMGLQQMTTVQQNTYVPALQGANILGRARTGTGKTIAFLLPAIETLLSLSLKDFVPGKDIGMLVVAPTRELAIQIADEAAQLLTYEPNYPVMTMYGGTSISGDVARLNKMIPSILVTTPGRFLDHLEDTKLRGRKFSDIVRGTKIVVLDETDRLLEGFPKDVKKIQTHLPRAEKRQTMMFSATVPDRLRRTIDNFMPVGFEYIDCVGDEANQTNERVTQTYAQLTSVDDYVMQLISVVSKSLREHDDPKVIVFFPAARLVKFFSLLFNDVLAMPVTAMHSRMSQSSRERANKAFCAAKTGVLFTSDVTARGIHIQGVTSVVQYGVPRNRELYIHRLGRTGRAGREGTGLLVLLPFESINKLKTGEITKLELRNDTSSASFAANARDFVRSNDGPIKRQAEAASLAFAAYLDLQYPKMAKVDLLEAAELFARAVGLSQLPDLPTNLAR